MKSKVIILVLLICFALVPVVEANTFGDTGLLTIPTAEILTTQDLNLSYQMKGSSDLIGLNYGFNDKVQVGANLKWPQGLNNGGDIYPSIKVNLLEENEEFKPDLSLGFVDREYYLVASKDTSLAGIRGHLGIFDDQHQGTRAFMGASKVLNPVTISTGSNNLELPVTTIMGEYNEGLNLGSKFAFNQYISADLGLVDTLDDVELTVGVNFTNEF
ncbi:MAG: hypothetical protein ACQEP9_01275 [Bacillota bacterium]